MTVPRLTLLSVALLATACASAPPAKPVPPPGPTFEQKMSWILRFEDQRVLHDPAPPLPPAPSVPARGQKPPVIVAPPSPPDLIRLLSDSEARVRRRAALAVGRVGLIEGIQPLTTLLTSDPEPEVRQVAAFALGLIGDARSRDALVAALADQAPLVQGSAAEALGLIGDAAAADAIGRMVGQIIQSGALAQAPSEDDDAKRDTPTAACRLGIFALVRLKAYPALASAVLDAEGRPRVSWWPVAYALQRLDDKRAMPALLVLVKDSNPYARAFAVKGLGGIKDPAALPVLMPLLTSGDRGVLIETIRALGKIGDPSVAPALQKFLHDAAVDAFVKAETVAALGGLRVTVENRSDMQGIIDDLLDLLSDAIPAVRAAALRSIASFDPENMLIVLSGLDPDPHWSVRASLATMLATLAPDVALPRLNAMLHDEDQRVIPAVLAALAKLKAPNAAAIMLERLKADDPAVRAAAANAIAELKPLNVIAALSEAYEFGQRDTTYIARAAALGAAAAYGAAAVPLVQQALKDKDWAVRVRAAGVIKQLDPNGVGGNVDASIRPAPTVLSADDYAALRVTNPPTSTMLYVDTDRGTFQIELAVIDAPLTVHNFVALARKGFFNGLSVHRVVPNFVVQDGDPRGDGEGGPGYTIRDEINELPYLRGTVGLALDWRDTGGSQYFVTHSPQPHLDAKYTVFGRVVSGMDVVEKIQQWDVIRRIRVWDGEQMTAEK